MKKNPLLAKYEAIFEERYQKMILVAMQMGLDAGMIAANEVFEMGAGRADRFRTAYIETVNAIANMTVNDSKDDTDIAWTKAKVDERIKKIVGTENFKPWDERYKIERV